MEIAAVRKISDNKMSALAGILPFAAQQAGTCQGMQGRQWERDVLTRNERRKRQNLSKGLDRKVIIRVSYFHFIHGVLINNSNFSV